MRFLLDENVPDQIAEFFRSKGHEVLLTREAFAAGTPDQLLLFASEVEGLIIVSKDKDFRRLKDMLPQGHHRRVTGGAGQILLGGRFLRRL